MKKIILTLTSIVLVSACSKKDDDPAPAPTNVYPTTQWYGNKGNSVDTIDVLNGYLYMTSKHKSGSAKSTSVGSFRKIKGDFELRVQYSDFRATGTNPTSETFAVFLTKMQGQTVTPILTGILGNEYMYAEDSDIANTQIKSTSNTSGEWYVKRTGSDFTTWFRAGTDTLFLNKTNYTAADLYMNFSINASDNTPTKTSVQIDDFSLTGSSASEAASDSFDSKDLTVY